MSLLQLAYVIALRRIISGWRLELILFLGILLAVALMASGVVFSDLLAEAALRRALTQATQEEANFSIRVYNGLDDPSGRSPSVYQSSLDFVKRRVSVPFQPYLQGQSHLFETSTLFFGGHPQLELANDVRPRGKVQYMSGLFPERVQVVRGHWPYSHPALSPPLSGRGARGEGRLDEALEVAVDTLGAELLHLDVGDEMEVFPAAGVTDPPVMKVKIVGVFLREDPESEFWYGARRAFSFKDDRWTIVPMFTTEDAILAQVGRVYPGLYADVTWFFYLDRQGMRAGDVGAIQGLIRAAEYDVRANLNHSSTFIRLDDVLEDYQEQLLLARIPLFLMVFLVTGILVYYLAMVAGLTVRSRTTEISMLKSRGATTLQIGVLALAEGTMLAVPAIALGPLLAVGVSTALGRAFFDLSSAGETPLPVTLGTDAFLLGASGALLAVVVLTISTLVAARQGIVEFRQAGARPPRAPFIHRYYLDVLFLVLLGLMWWQIQTRGSFLVRPLGGAGAQGDMPLEIDFSLLLGPVLGLLALGLLVMRVFPIAVALLARVAEPVGPPWLVQGLRSVSRDPIMPGALVVLLMLATSLGVIGSAFSSTIERSQRDRALYAAGADLRLEHSGQQQGGSRASVALIGLSDIVGGEARGREPTLDGVDRVAEVERASGSLLTRGFSSEGVSVLAVDTDSFAHVAWYRPDFAGGKSLEELTRVITPSSSIFPLPLAPGSGDRPEAASLTISQLITSVPMREGVRGEGIALPENATALAIWTRPDRPDSRYSLTARLQDSGGYYFDVFVGDLNFKGWRRLEAKLSPIPPPSRTFGDRPPSPAVAPPFTLLSFVIGTRAGVSEPGILFLDDLAAITPEGEKILDDMSSNLGGSQGGDLQSAPSSPTWGWHVLEDYSRPGLYVLESSEAVARTNTGGPGVGGVERSAAFSWAPGGVGIRGIRVGNPEGPIPAVVSKAFLDIAEARVGDTLTLGMSTYSLPVRPVAVADYFPTLDPREEPFVVVDLKTFNHYTNLHSQRLGGGSSELWVSLTESVRSSPDDPHHAVIEALRGRGINVREAHVASEMVSQRVEQPLINAGWGGLLVLMFLALVLASASGVMMFSYMDTRNRQAEFALLRTMGFSRGQLNGVVWFNLFLMVVCGIGLGTLAGQLIGASLLPVLEIAEEGVRVTPPMVLQMNWVALLVSYLVLAGVTGSTVVWLAWVTARLEIQRVLRIGEA